MSWPLVKYVLTAALRDRLLISLLLLLLVGVSMAIFMGSGAVVEKTRFALVFAAGGLRLMGVLGLVLFAVFHIRRSFESKDVEFLLSRPISRVQFLLSFAAAFILLGALFGVGVGAALFILGPQHLNPGFPLWVASIVAENIIMVSVALFFAMILSSAATAAMVTIAFYVLARMMGQILGIIDHPSHHAYSEFLAFVMQVVSSVTPRLDLMGQTSWLVYGPGEGIAYGFVFLQGLIFTILILLASLIDLLRRQF
jgi:hypothetical protein